MPVRRGGPPCGPGGDPIRTLARKDLAGRGSGPAVVSVPALLGITYGLLVDLLKRQGEGRLQVVSLFFGPALPVGAIPGP